MPLFSSQTAVVIVFRPLEAKLSPKTNKSHKIDAYCRCQIGWHYGRTTGDDESGLNPT